MATAARNSTKMSRITWAFGFRCEVRMSTFVMRLQRIAAPNELMVQQSSTCAHSVEPRSARLKSQRLSTSETGKTHQKPIGKKMPSTSAAGRRKTAFRRKEAKAAIRTLPVL